MWELYSAVKTMWGWRVMRDGHFVTAFTGFGRDNKWLAEDYAAWSNRQSAECHEPNIVVL
jgi:hypothetical protein